MEEEFQLDDGLIYLNHAACSPWPQRTARAVQAFAEEVAAKGSVNYQAWGEQEALLHERVARLLGTQPENVALTRNTSEGLSLVAHGLDWQDGDEVVFCGEEFPSNRYPWESLASRGVITRQVQCCGTENPEVMLAEAINSNTRLLAVSSVQYATGLRMDLVRLGEMCREKGLLFIVDAIQSLGALPFDVSQIQAHAVAFGGHKWLMGPEGIGGVYVSPELRDQLTLHNFGWHMPEQIDFDAQDWQPARTARRFEAGSPNTMGIHALNASLSLLLEEVGMDQVGAQVLSKAEFLFQALSRIDGVEIITPQTTGRFAGIVTFAIPGQDALALHRHLTKNGVVCVPRGGGIRFAPHFYTPTDKLREAVELVSGFLRVL